MKIAPHDLECLAHHPDILALPPPIRAEVVAALPDFLENGCLECRRYSEQDHCWRIRFRAQGPDGLRHQRSITLGDEGPALFAAQLLMDFKRELQAEVQTQEARQAAASGDVKLSREKERRLKQLFMERAPGGPRFKRQAWADLDKSFLNQPLDIATLHVALAAGRVKAPAPGRPRQTWWPRPPQVDPTLRPSVMSAVGN